MKAAIAIMYIGYGQSRRICSFRRVNSMGDFACRMRNLVAPFPSSHGVDVSEPNCRFRQFGALP